MSVWGLTSGSAGMVAQVRALASALKLSPEMKKIEIRKPFAWLPNAVFASPLRYLIVSHLLAPESDSLEPPLPELVISCGRRAALVAMGLRARMRGHTRFIHIQDPQVSAKYFDLVVAMEHDKITGTNVIKTRFALHAITPDVLQEAQQKFAATFAPFPKPLVAVLLGGSTNKYNFTKEAMAKVMMALQSVLQKTEVSLLITPSRRTGEENIAMLRQAFAGNKRIYMYDSAGENPYLGMLALADAIIVTNDSVNMMSEAHATGKPIYILELPGHGDSKPARFAERMLEEKIARPLGSKIEDWNYNVQDEMARLAEEIRKRLG